MAKKAYDYASVIKGLKDSAKKAFAKLANEIEENPVALAMVSHGALKSKLRISVAATWANVDKDTATILRGRAAATLNEAWQGGLFNSDKVGSVYAHFSGTTMLSLSSTPIGALLVRAMHKTVEQGVNEVKQGQAPRSIMFPIVKVDKETKEEDVTWHLSYRLARAVLVAMGEVPGKDAEEVKAGIAKLVKANRPKKQKDAATPKPKVLKPAKVEPQTQLGAELEKLAA